MSEQTWHEQVAALRERMAKGSEWGGLADDAIALAEQMAERLDALEAEIRAGHSLTVQRIVLENQVQGHPEPLWTLHRSEDRISALEAAGDGLVGRLHKVLVSEDPCERDPMIPGCACEHCEADREALAAWREAKGGGDGE